MDPYQKRGCTMVTSRRFVIYRSRDLGVTSRLQGFSRTLSAECTSPTVERVMLKQIASFALSQWQPCMQAIRRCLIEFKKLSKSHKTILRQLQLERRLQQLSKRLSYMVQMVCRRSRVQLKSLVAMEMNQISMVFVDG